MLVLEGIELFVDVSGLAGHKANQLRIVTTQTLITTHKGDAITSLYQWLYLVRAEAPCRASKWKVMAPISMRNLVLFLVVNSVFRWEAIRNRWTSIMDLLSFVAVSLLKANWILSLTLS